MTNKNYRTQVTQTQNHERNMRSMWISLIYVNETKRSIQMGDYGREKNMTQNHSSPLDEKVKKLEGR